MTRRRGRCGGNNNFRGCRELTGEIVRASLHSDSVPSSVYQKTTPKILCRTQSDLVRTSDAQTHTKPQRDRSASVSHDTIKRDKYLQSSTEICQPTLGGHASSSKLRQWVRIVYSSISCCRKLTEVMGIIHACVHSLT